MNTVKDLLDLYIKRKELLTGEIMASVIFAFFFMFTGMIFINWLILGVNLSNEYQDLARNGGMLLVGTFLFVSGIFLSSFLSIPLKKIKAFFIFHLYGGDILFEIKEGDFDYKKITNKFEFQGVLRNKFEDLECLYLNWSSEGMITKDFFKNYRFTFKAKVFPHGFGIIIAGIDLENCLMLRINNDNGLFIMPHVRKRGFWEIQGIREEMNNRIKINENGEFLNFRVDLRGKLLNLKIWQGPRCIKDFSYLLPDYFPLIPVEAKTGMQDNVILKTKFPRYGKIGFRAFGPDEKAIITELKVERLKDSQPNPQ